MEVPATLVPVIMKYVGAIASMKVPFKIRNSSPLIVLTVVE